MPRFAPAIPNSTSPALVVGDGVAEPVGPLSGGGVVAHYYSPAEVAQSFRTSYAAVRGILRGIARAIGFFCATF